LFYLYHVFNCCHRSQRSSRVKGIADLRFVLNDLHQPFLKVVKYGLLNDESFCVETSLGIAIHSASIGCLSCLLEIRLLKHDEWIIASKFKGALSHVPASQSGNYVAAIVSACVLNSSYSAVSHYLFNLIVARKHIAKLTLVETTTTFETLVGLTLQQKHFQVQVRSKELSSNAS